MRVITEAGAVTSRPMKPIKLWTGADPVEHEAMLQLVNIATMPFIHDHVAVMPDVHLGKGATVGSVIATRGAIIPAAVGVDIGCGMVAVMTDIRAEELPDNLFAIRSAIEAEIPHGRSNNGGEGDKGAHRQVYESTEVAVGTLYYDFKQILEKHPKLLREGMLPRIFKQAGTLGTGNHFIELCLDENNRVWIMLHSGSRGTGNSIGSYFINRAKEHMEKWYVTLPDKDLAYLPEKTEDFRDYMQAVSWAQEYASMNRALMLRNAVWAISRTLKRSVALTMTAVNCHHNYVNKERHFGEWVYVTRKGAVSAKEGELGIIPGSMGAKSFIVSGLGNRDSFHSCSHGAGRKHSRTAAKKLFTLEQHAAATLGVECRKDEDVIDETPMAYKDIDDVMRAQSDLVSIVHTLKQVICVKG